MNYFEDINEFYNNFYIFLSKDLSHFFKDNEEIIKNKKKKFPYYSIEDLKFRLVRDTLIDKSEYEKVMFNMMKEKNLNQKNFILRYFLMKKI